MRENNGVRVKVTNDAGRGSIERGSGQAGSMGEEGGLKPVGGEISYSKQPVDQSHQRGIYFVPGSDSKQKAQEKDMGGVGSYGMEDGEHRDFFKDKH